MRLLQQISISSSLAQLSISRSPGDIRTGVDKMELSVEGNLDFRVDIHNEHAQIRIDQTDAFASAGLKKPLRMALDWCKRGEQAGLQVIGTIVQEGKEFVRIERGGKPIISQAARTGYDDRRLTIKAMPNVPPEITVERGSADIRFQGGIAVNWQNREGQGQYTPVRLDITMTPHQVDISVVPGVELNFPAPTSSVDFAV